MLKSKEEVIRESNLQTNSINKIKSTLLETLNSHLTIKALKVVWHKGYAN